jgi:hypothetical protein
LNLLRPSFVPGRRTSQDFGVEDGDVPGPVRPVPELRPRARWGSNVLRGGRFRLELKTVFMVRHDFHWLSDGESEVPTVRGLSMALSKLSVEGEGEGGVLGEGEIVEV